jgi:hypothetical protein
MLTQIKTYLDRQVQYASMYNNGRTKIMPNASVSWDPRPWRELAGQDITPYYTFNLAHFKRELEWIRDEFKTPVLDPAGNKMIMMDNWNEYGEGHYMMPTYSIPAYKDGKVGFGYLDVVRAVFGTTPFDKDHNDIHPLEAGFGPYDKWYPPAWTQAHQPNFPVPVDHSLNITPTVTPPPSSWVSSSGYSSPSGAPTGSAPGSSHDTSQTPGTSLDSSADESGNESEDLSGPNDSSYDESFIPVSGDDPSSNGEDEPRGSGVWPIVLVIVVVMAGSGIAAYILIIKRKTVQQ